MNDSTGSAVIAGEARSATIRVYGGIGVKIGGDPVSIGGPMQQKLLALLVVRGDSAASNDWLAEHLWSDHERPPDPIPTVRTYMSRLRQALPAPAKEWIETGSSGYRFTAPNDAVETRRFADLRQQARAARDRDDPETAIRLLDDALCLVRGEPFEELIDLDWARAQIEKLRLDHLEAQEERWEAALDLGRHTQITGELAAFTVEHANRDRAARQYALALYRSGRTSDALRVLDEHRRNLAETTGLDPSSAFAELEDALLRGDPSLDAPSQGRPLRGYRLLEHVGSGAFSIVWRAIQPSVDREVAIKQIREELTSSPQFIRRFEAEAHTVAQIEHPHIVPLIDFWRDPDSAYLVMRWLGGGTLEMRLDHGPLGVTDAVNIIEQVGAALHAAHLAGVVHRDVKTANILFDEAGHAFLTDFGIALPTAKSSGPEAALSPGSPAYSSPEQLRQERLAPTSDIFSLGVVVFECLAGTLPFARESTAADLVQRQLTERFPSLGSVRPELPDHVIAAVDRATANDPAERFESVLEFVSALRGTDDLAVISSVLVGDVKNPYQGLRNFDEADVENFFGRDRLVDEFIQQLSRDGLRSRCLTVVGPSGSGKSSVVQAGLVPALRAGRLEGADKWFITTMQPGSHPYEALEAALLRIAVNPPASLVDQLRDGDRGILRSAKRCLAPDRDRVLVVVDQLEELFTSAQAETADRFLRALAVAVEDPTSPLRIVATLRADYYDRPLAHGQFAPILKATSVDVTPLAPDELERAITGPAGRHGVGFEPGLVATIAAEASGQPAPLPLLQHAMAELFERRDDGRITYASYQEIGGLAGSLASRAEQIFLAGSADEQLAARTVFGQLVNVEETSADLRRRRLQADLGSDDATDSVLDRYGAARLLTFDRDVTSREPTVEVAHEALLREWPRLVRWLDDDRSLLRSVARLSNSADAWQEGGRTAADLYRGARLESATDLLASTPERLRPVDREFVAESAAQAESERQTEQERIRRLRRLVTVVGAALVVAVIAGALALQQQRRADDEARQASARGLAAQAAVVADRELDTALLLAANAAAIETSPETEEGLLAVLARAEFLESASPFPGPSGLEFLKSSGGVTVALYDDNIIRSFDALSDEPLGPDIPVAPSDRTESLFLSDDGSTVALVSGETFSVWDVASGAVKLHQAEAPPFSQPVLTANGSYVYVADPNGPAPKVYDVGQGSLLGSAGPDDEGFVLGSPASSGDEQLLYRVAEIEPEGGPPVSSELATFDLPSLEPIGPPTVIDAVVHGIFPSGDGEVVAGVSVVPAAVTFIDGDSLEVLGAPQSLQAGRFATAMWNPSSTRFAAGTLESEFTIFDRDTGAVEAELLGRASLQQGAGWIDDDRFFIVTDGRKFVWDLSEPSPLATPQDAWSGASVFRDGRWMGSNGETADVYSLAGEVTTVELPTDTQCRDVLDPDPFGSAALILCWPAPEPDWAYGMLVVDVDSGRLLRGVQPVFDDFGTEDWAPNADGTRVAVAGSPGVFGGPQVGLLAVLDMTTGRFERPPVEIDQWTGATVAWTPDYSLLLTAGQAGELLFVDPDSLEIVDRVMLTANRAITDLTFDTSGSVVHASNEQGEIWSVDIATRSPLGPPLTGSTAQFQSVTFSPDGSRAAATGRDGNIRIWDSESGRIFGADLAGGDAEYVRFIDEDTLISFRRFGPYPVIRWDIGTDRLLATACELAGRSLTAAELALFAADLPDGDVCG